MTGAYKSLPACLSACAGFAAGTTGDQSGDTFACRRYHLTAAAGGGNAKTTHCPHTGLVSRNALTETGAATGPCKP